jgi:hypothetical protein
VVGLISVEPSLHGPSRYAQRASSRGGLDSFKVQPVDRAWAYKRFDFGDDFRVEALFEAPFFTASSEVPGKASFTSHNPSLTSTNSLVSLRKR